MRKKILYIGTLVMILVLVCGCGRTVSTTTINENLILKNPKYSVVGTWTVPGEGLSITCKEDGTYTSTDTDNPRGTYTYLSENQYFTISDIFGDLEYVTYVNEKNEEVLMGAILPDVIIVYDLKNKNEQYYFHEGREPVAQEDVIGKWLDATGNEYTMDLRADGTYFSNEEQGTYTIRTDGDTTYLTTILNDKQKEYIILRYDNHLFLYQENGAMFLYNQQ